MIKWNPNTFTHCLWRLRHLENFVVAVKNLISCNNSQFSNFWIQHDIVFQEPLISKHTPFWWKSFQKNVIDFTYQMLSHPSDLNASHCSLPQAYTTFRHVRHCHHINVPFIPSMRKRQSSKKELTQPTLSDLFCRVYRVAARDTSATRSSSVVPFLWRESCNRCRPRKRSPNYCALLTPSVVPNCIAHTPHSNTRSGGVWWSCQVCFVPSQIQPAWSCISFLTHSPLSYSFGSCISRSSLVVSILFDCELCLPFITLLDPTHTEPSPSQTSNSLSRPTCVSTFHVRVYRFHTSCPFDCEICFDRDWSCCWLTPDNHLLLACCLPCRCSPATSSSPWSWASPTGLYFRAPSSSDLDSWPNLTSSIQ